MQKYICELLADHSLDQLVGLQVDAGRRLVHQQYFGSSLNYNTVTMRARAMQMSCRCPREKLLPESSTALYSLRLYSPTSFSLSLICVHRSTFCKHCAISASAYLSSGSILDLMVPVKSTGSCGIIATLCRR